MTLNIIDITTSMMRSVNKAVTTMSGITLREMPSVNMEPVPAFVVKGSRGVFVSVIRFDEPMKKWSRGAIVVTVLGNQIQTLFSKNYGVDGNSSDGDIIDVCGEFGNVIAGGFKKEIVNLGFGEVQISVPVNYYKDFEEKLDLVVHKKYELAFVHEGSDLLKVDVSMESPD